MKVGATGDSATSGTDYTAVDDFDVTIPASSQERDRDVHAHPHRRRGRRGARDDHGIAGSAPGLTVTGASLTLSDDDTYAFVFSKSTVNLEETASPTGTYTVRLSKLPTDEVSVTLASG